MPTGTKESTASEGWGAEPVVPPRIRPSHPQPSNAVLTGFSSNPCHSSTNLLKKLIPRCLGGSGGFWRGFPTVKDYDVSDLHDYLASSLFGDLRGKFVLLLLEIGKLHFHQSVQSQRRVEALQKCIAHSGMAEFHDGLQ